MRIPYHAAYGSIGTYSLDDCNVSEEGHFAELLLRTQVQHAEVFEEIILPRPQEDKRKNSWRCLPQGYTRCAAISAILPASTRVASAPQAKAPCTWGLEKLELDIRVRCSSPCVHHERIRAEEESRFAVRTPENKISLYVHHARETGIV